MLRVTLKRREWPGDEAILGECIAVYIIILTDEGIDVLYIYSVMIAHKPRPKANTYKTMLLK